MTTIANEVKVLVESKVEKSIKKIMGNTPHTWLTHYGWKEVDKHPGYNEQTYEHPKYSKHLIHVTQKQINHYFNTNRIATITPDNTEEYLRHFKMKKEGK